MKASVTGLLVLLLVALTKADGRICARSCSASKDSDVLYEPGKEYRYQYHGDVVTRSRATQSQESRMTVRAYVIITARTQCDLKMRVMNLAVDDVPGPDSQWFRDAVEKYDLHFSYTNGMISYLCPHEEEEVVATNFKRGILSAIQAKMTNMEKTEALVYEADVLGECETEYRLTHPDELVINKTKHNCRYNNYLPYIPSQHYSRRDLTGQAPFQSSEQSCLMHLTDKVWSRVECVEEMYIREFKEFFQEEESKSTSNGNSLASVTVTTTLALEAGPEDSQEEFAKDGVQKRRESLRMDLEGAIESIDKRLHHDSNIVEQIQVAMNYLIATMGSDSGMTEKRPYAFSHLATLIDQLEEEVEINDVWETYVNDRVTRHYMLDATILCESRACMKLLTTLAAESPEYFPKSRVIGWLTGVHFQTHSHPDSVEYLMELAHNNAEVEDQAVMAASSIIHQLCQRNRFNCREHARPLLDYSKEKIGDSCGYDGSKEERRHVKLSLRALSNAGVQPEGHFIERCYKNKLMKASVRRAAFETYRRANCDDLDLETPWQILEDAEDDVSVRIAAYLSVVKCAPETPKFFTRVKNLLHKEEVNQVGSYIWTHVSNLAERPGGNSRSRELSYLANHHTLRAKFNTNAFRTSRNYRFAQFSKLLNIGASLDSDLVFTPDSYIPQIENHRFHVDFLENSIEAFEIGGEFEGLEGIIEGFFGKAGYFENEEIQKALETMRPKRDIHEDKIQKFQDLYDSRTRTEGVEGDEVTWPKADVHIRLFGREIFYQDLCKSDPLLFIKQLVQQLSAPRSFQILQQELVSPTLLGFPLRLRLNATGSVNYEHTGEFSYPHPDEFHLEGEVKASVVMAMDETLMVEGYGSTSGVRRRSTHVSSTELGGKIEYQNGKIVDVQFKIPNQELARVSSSVKVALYENYRQDWSEADYEGPSEKSEFCSHDDMRRITGLEFCSSSDRAVLQTDSEESIPGDVYSAEYTLTKTDTFDFYHFYFKKERRDLDITFDTPGSSVDRKLEFQTRLRPGNVKGTLSVPGKSYDVEGNYENSETLKTIALQYKEDSVSKGNFEFTLPITAENNGVMMTPKIVLNLNSLFNLNFDGTFKRGTDQFLLEGHTECSLMENPLDFKASWKYESDQHKIEGNVMIGEAFASTTGTLFLNGEKTLVQIDSEYGMNKDKPNTLALTFDKTLFSEEDGVRHTGYLSMESSVGNTNVEMEYDYGFDHVIMDTNVTVVGTEVTSKVVIKNEITEKNNDFEITLSFASPQLDMNYLSQAIYKLSDNAFLGELEISLGSNLNTKFTASYLYEMEPLHLQGGFHFHLNDYVVQFVHEIDFSQPGMMLITSSDVIGPAAGILQVEAFYDRMAPFNASFDVHAGYGEDQFGLKAFTFSSDDWSQFDGSAEAIWFDWSYSVEHQVQWEEDKKTFLFTCQEGNTVNVVLETEPDFNFNVAFQRSVEDEPIIKYGIERRTEEESTTYETYLQSSGNDFFHLTAVDMGENSYSGKAKFLDSQLELTGQLTHTERDHIEGQAQATLTYPSGETQQSDISFKNTYDGQTRDLQFSSSYGSEVIQGHFTMMHKDGWFSDDERKITISLETPFDGMKRMAMAFESHRDWAEPWFAEAEWEEMKIRGEIQLGDITDLEAKIQYMDGGTCDSIVHFYNKYDGQHYTAGAIVGITKAHEPWSVEVNATKNDNFEEHMLDMTLTCQSPVFQTPFEAKGKYKTTSTNVEAEVEFGTDSRTRVSFRGEDEKVSEVQKHVGSLNLDSPWFDPVFLNMENLYDSGSFNVSIDLRTSLEHVNNVNAEISVNYAKPEETSAHFYLSHQDLQITFEMIHNLSDGSLVQQMQGSFNSVVLNYDLNAKWDENCIPENSEGHLSLNGFLDQSFELIFAHTREDNKFNTRLTGTLDGHQARLIHFFEFDHPFKWSSDVQLNLPEEQLVLARLFLNSKRDLSTFESTFHLNTPWTEAFVANFEIHRENNPAEYELEATYGDKTLFNIVVNSSESFTWNKANASMEVSSSLFNNAKLLWQHDFNSDHLMALEFSYGEIFHIEAKNHLKYEESIFKKEFKGYEMAASLKMEKPELNFKTNFSFGDSLSGEFQAQWYDYNFAVKSSIPENTVFSATLSYPGEHFHSKLVYESNADRTPNFSFEFNENETNIVTISGQFHSFYPHFDAEFNAYYFDKYAGIPKNGKLELKADMTQIKDYKFKGTLKLNSDFEGFEEYSADIDTGMTIGKEEFEAHLQGSLHAQEWHYKTQVSGDIKFDKEFELNYNSSYDISYGEQVQDKKDFNFMFKYYENELVEGFISTTPKWDTSAYSAYFRYQDENLKTYVTPGNDIKYEFTLNVTKNVLRIDALRTDEEGEGTEPFKFLRGTVNWNLKKIKKQIVVNLTSDIPFIRNIKGQLVIQQRKGLAANFKLRVNNEDLTGFVRFVDRGGNNAGKIMIKIENSIIQPFTTNSSIQYNISPNEVTADLDMEVNGEKEWAKASIKGSFTESYIRFNLPIKNFNDFDLTVTLEMETAYSINVDLNSSQFCFSLSGNLTRFFDIGSLTSTYTHKCSGNPLYDFKVQYNFEESKNELNAETYLNVEDFGTLFKFIINGNSNLKDGEVRIESEIYPYFHHITDLFFKTSDDVFSFGVHTQEGSTDETRFQFKVLFSEKKSEIEIEVGEIKVISMQADYEFSKSAQSIEGSLMHAIFGYPFNVKLSHKGRITSKSGGIELHLSTDGSFDHVDFTMDYKKTGDVIEGNFKLETSNGDADGKATIEITDNKYDFNAEMHSTIHSFDNYQVEFFYENKEDGKRVDIKTMQDDIEFEMHFMQSQEEDMAILHMDSKLPLEKFSSFEVELGYPMEESIDPSYKLKAGFVLLNEEYKIATQHKHSASWRSQETIFSVNTSPRLIGKYDVTFKYDLDGQTAFNFESFKGQFGFNGSWEVTDENVLIELGTDLFYFKQGEYKMKVDIPLKIYQKGEFEFSRVNSDQDFDIHLLVGDRYREGDVTLNIHHSEDKKTYQLNYKYKNRLDIDALWEKWNVNAKIKFTGKRIAATSGIINVTTDFEGFEIIKGSWNFQSKRKVYSGMITFDIGQKGSVKFDASLSSQPKGISNPWEGALLEMSFESPFTEHHKLSAEYNVPETKIALSYQKGSEMFDMNLNGSFLDSNGNISFSGNLPINYLSNFDFNFEYDFRSNFKISFKSHLEETLMQADFEIASNFLMAHSGISLSSPFTEPLEVITKWSFDESPFAFEMSWKYGANEVTVSTNFEFSDTNGNFKIRYISPIEVASLFEFEGMYDLTDSNDMKLSATLKFNEHSFQAESTVMNNGGQFSLKTMGSMKAFERSGSVNFELRAADKDYNISFSGETDISEVLFISGTISGINLLLNVRYGENDIINMNLDFSKADVRFAWKDIYFNITANYEKVGNGYKIDYTMQSSEIPPLSIKADASIGEKHEGNIKVVFGEKEYSVNGSLSFKAKSSSLEFRFTSSEDSYNPIVISAMYDMSDFMQGRMKAQADLASLSFEWGEKLELSLKGQRRGKRTKLYLEVKTPFDSVPELHCGYEGDWIWKHPNIDFNFTAYAEWSEKVTFTGLFKLKKDRFNLETTVETPFSAFENLSFMMKNNKNNIEAVFKNNGSEWSLVCDYEFSPKFYVSATAKTPIPGFKEISFKSSIGMEDQKFNAEAQLDWENDSFKVNVEAEMWNLEIHLETPWEPLRNASFATSLRTESEELMYNLNVKWNSSTVEMTFVYSPVQLQLKGAYVSQEKEIGAFNFGYLFDGITYQVDAKLEVPFIKAFPFTGSVHVSYQLIHIIIKMPSPYKFALELEAKDYLRFEGSFDDPYGNSPYVFKINHTSPGPHSKELAVQVEIAKDSNWLSVEADFVNDWKAEAHICDYISMNLTRSEQGVPMFGFNMENQDFDLEYMALVVSFGFLESPIFEDSLSLAYRVKGKEMVESELRWQSDDEDPQIHITLDLDNSLEIIQSMEITIPKVNIFQTDGKIEVTAKKNEEEVYRIVYDAVYLQPPTFTHSLTIQFPDWTADLSASLTRSNFKLSASYPDEGSQHTLLVSWPRELSLEKLTLQVELSSPYLEEGDVQMLFDFTVQQRLHFTLASSVSYGTNKIEMNGRFQFVRKLRKVVVEAAVTSDWVGNHSLTFNAGWMRNINGSLKIVTWDQEHNVKLLINREEYTAEFTVDSPWISSKEIKITGMMNKDIESNKVLIEATLESDESDYSIEGKFESTDERYIDGYFVMKRKYEDVFRISGYFQHNANSVDLKFAFGSDVVKFSCNVAFSYENTEEKFHVTFDLSNSYFTYINSNLYFTINKNWRERHYFRVNIFNGYSFKFSIELGEEAGEFEISTSAKGTDFCAEIEYNVSDNFEFEIKLNTPFNDVELFHFEIEWPLRASSNIYIDFFYQWYDDHVSFKFDFSPDSFFGWSAGAYFTSSIEGYERFSLQTPQMDSKSKYIVLIEYPTGKIGLNAKLDIKEYNHRLNNLVFTIDLPFEEYPIISLYFSSFSEKGTGIEIRVGKIGFSSLVDFSFTESYYELKTSTSFNEYKSESYLRLYKIDDRFRVIYRNDLEMKDMTDIKFFEAECRYDPEERIMFVAKTDQDELVKVHFSWGADKVVAITTPKIFLGYLILNLESSENKDDYEVEVGVLSSRVAATYDKYGFHISQVNLGYGRKLKLAGKAGESQFGIEGKITLHPMYNGNLNIKNKLIMHINEKKLGICTYLQTNRGFFEDSYTTDLKIYLPEQTLHWDTVLKTSSASLNFWSYFKWNDADQQEEPFVVTIDYDDLSASNGNDHVLQAVFSYPQIQNLTLQGNLTCSGDYVFHGTAEFVDENDPEKSIFFKINSAPSSESGVILVDADITQPSSNSVVEFSAEITESICNTASYQMKYWSHSQQKWEVLHLTTEVEQEKHGWNFNANLNKSESDWGYNYNGSLLHHDDSFYFSFMSASQHFMDYWRFETSVNKYLPEVDVQLQIGQSLLEPHEIGRIRAGLHNPLEMGVIVDHERFGVWRQDARAGLRLRNREILQLLVEYDPSFDFSDENLIYRLISPASKVSNAWLRDLSYAGFAFKDFASSEFEEIARVAFHQDTFRTIQSYWQDKCNTFTHSLSSTFETLEHDLRDAYEQNLKPFVDPVWDSASEVFERILFFFESNFPSFAFNWEHLVEFMSVEYVRVHDKFIEEWYLLENWWYETNEAMSIAFKDNMYEVVGTINSVVDAVSLQLTELQHTYGPTFDSYKMAFERYSQELEAVFGGQCWSKVRNQINRLRASLDQVIYAGEQFIQAREYASLLNSFSEWVAQWHRENQQRFEDGMFRLQYAITRSALFSELEREFQEVERFFRDVMTYGFYETFQQRFSEVGPRIMAQADEVVRELRQKYHEFQEYSRGNILFDYLDAVTADAFDRMIRTWEDWRAGEYEVLNTLQRVFVAFVDGFKNGIQKGIDFTEESIVFEPKMKGKIVYNQYLPVPWNNFLERPQWFHLVNIFQKESPAVESKRKLAEGMDALYSVFEAYTIPGRMLPPFTATATVYGQQISTFDRLHYQFLGTCTYLMAKDFVGGDFEVIGDYSKSDNGEISLTSMTIRAKGGADVTLNVDGTFEARSLGDAEVHTDEHFVAYKQEELFVTCNSVSRGCSVTVGAKYFGRLDGLFGNYNYEPSDDSMGPDGVKREDGNDIANSWSVASQPCYQENQVVAVEYLSQVSNYGNCHELFLRAASPLSRCFLRIDPRPYFWHCVRDMKRPSYGNDHRNTPCDASDAYRTNCATLGIHMPALHQCPRAEGEKVDEEEEEEVIEKQTRVIVDKSVAPPRQVVPQRASATCSMPGKDETVPEGWSHTYEKETQGSADIAFVIELATCNKDRNLQLLLRLIKVTLKRGGIQDVKYALVTTQGGQIVDISSDMISEDELNTQLGNLVLEGPKSDDGGAEAVKAAARQLKWRPGVSRNIVQLPCRACDDGDAVSEALSENDVTLHILTKFKVVMSGPNPKKSKLMANKVYGFDAKRIYTPKDTKKFVGNVNMRKLFQDPEGSSCFQASQDSDGSVYNVNKWTSKSAVVEKKYLGVIGQSILKSSHAPECQECRCLRQGGGAEISCRKCGEEWPAVEEREDHGVRIQEAPQERRPDTRQKESDGNVAHDIKQTFKEDFIEENAALAKLGDSENDEDSVAQGQVEEEPEEPQEVAQEQEALEEEEEEEEEEDESDEVEEYNYDYYDDDYRK